MNDFRVGHQLLVGKTTLKSLEVIDVIERNKVFSVVDEEKQIKNVHVDDASLFSYFSNNITQPETQDTEGRFTVEGGGQAHLIKWDCGQKVEFEVELKGATLKVKGYIIRNYWNDYYLISEQGVSIPGRYWKVAHSKCSKVI